MQINYNKMLHTKILSISAFNLKYLTEYAKLNSVLIQSLFYIYIYI